MMLSNATHPRLITVLPIGMDPRKLSVFRMAFRMHHSHQLYQLLDEAPGSTPDLAIVDVDSMEGWGAWHNFRDNHPHLPALIVTTTPPDSAPAAVLRKPIRVETLFPQMRELLSQQTLQAPAASPTILPLPPGQPAASSSASAAQAYVASIAQQLDQTVTTSQQAYLAEKNARQTQAVRPETARPAATVLPAPVQLKQESVSTAIPTMVAANSAQPGTPGKISFERFDPQAGLFGLVARLLRQRCSALVYVHEKPVLAMQVEQDKVLLLQPLSSLQALCTVPSAAVSHQMQPLPSTLLSVEELRPQSLAWQLAIWTCQGRLMRGIQPDTPLRLRYWPNLTRLASIPDAMRITAFLTKTPVNLKLLTHMLKVPPAHVFNYLAAAYAIGILDLPSRGNGIGIISSEPVRPQIKRHTETETIQPVAVSSPPSPPQGRLLSRLLKKVMGL